MNALEVLKADHDKVRKLFMEFRTAASEKDAAKMGDLNRKIFDELDTHTAIEERVMPLIAEIGEEQGFTLIFNKFEDSGLLWATPGADITDLVLERFNALPTPEG